MTYQAETLGLIVSVVPEYLGRREDEADRLAYVWAYHVTILNRSDHIVQLLARSWRITDANGATEDVHGPGVVGEQPVILPGAKYVYSSGCPLLTGSGAMEGAYHMRRTSDDWRFDIAIPAFALERPRARGSIH
jgi:ApaG protein